MRKLRHLEQVSGKTAHKAAGAHLIVEFKVELLKMPEQIGSYVCLDPYPEGMPPVGHDIVADRSQRIANPDCGHYSEECPESLVRKQSVHRVTRHYRKCQINARREHSTDHIQKKQFNMRPEIPQKSLQHGIRSISPSSFFCTGPYARSGSTAHCRRYRHC